jgi:hypothetical protein
MYKFSNGVVVFTEEDKENYIKAGYILVEETKPVAEEKKEKIVEEEDSNGIVGKKYSRDNSKTGRLYKSYK